MGDSRNTLVVLLTMHRSGSSLTASLLQRLGMSLGPFELNGAAPSNPYGHFESVPFLILNRKIQNLVFGFADDVPDSDETLARFLQSRGEWGDEAQIPEELYAEGRALVRVLVASGHVSGFKDPRTVLTWPFWKKVLEDQPDVRVVPVSLIRTPHEIAMSLVSRRDGRCGYWTSLDVVAVHFRCQMAILESYHQPPPCLCFGGPNYLETLGVVARHCGLEWNCDLVSHGIDRSCVHHVPATVHHESQSLFNSLLGIETGAPLSDLDRTQFETDARLVETLRLQQLRESNEQLSNSRRQTQEAEFRASDSKERARQLQEQLLDALARLSDLQSRWIAESQRLHEVMNSQQNRLEQLDNHLTESRYREHQMLIETEHLKRRLGKIEAHALLGPALRARRGLRRIVNSMSTGPEQ